MRISLNLLICILGLAVTLKGAPPESTGKWNVLFVVADDLRPELGCYGAPAITPNLDGLAAQGVLFERAYCQQSLCNPSRSSMLTGLRPDSLGLWVNGTHFRQLKPDVITLPQWFKQQGYVTRDVGKIFHNWHTTEHGDRRSWSAPEFLHYANHGDDHPDIDEPLPKDLATAPKCERMAVPDAAYYDGRVANEAIRVLEEIREQRFFLALGFWKPHSPFNAPAQYWDRYQRSAIPVLNPARPSGAPELAFHDGRELRGLPPNQLTFTSEQAAEIRHGYFANTTYMDSQLGKVLAALDRFGLTDSTLIVFLGDHGYHLGEHDLWAKTSCFELDARVPLIIAVPGEKNAGVKTSALAELVDLYPTLVDLCGLPSPPGLDGQSLRTVLENPRATVKSAALTQHPRPAYYDRTPAGVPDAMGYSVRTDKVRYTEWRDWKTGNVIARELYDHRSDPAELTNAIESPSDPAALTEAVQELRRRVPISAGSPSR